MTLVEIYRGYEIKKVDKNGREFYHSDGNNYSSLQSLKTAIDVRVKSGLKPLVFYPSGWSNVYDQGLSSRSFSFDTFAANYSSRVNIGNVRKFEDKTIELDLYLTVV